MKGEKKRKKKRLVDYSPTAGVCVASLCFGLQFFRDIFFLLFFLLSFQAFFCLSTSIFLRLSLFSTSGDRSSARTVWETTPSARTRVLFGRGFGKYLVLVHDLPKGVRILIPVFRHRCVASISLSCPRWQLVPSARAHARGPTERLIRDITCRALWVGVASDQGDIASCI